LSDIVNLMTYDPHRNDSLSNSHFPASVLSSPRLNRAFPA
jgi:hypothetical protein